MRIFFSFKKKFPNFLPRVYIYIYLQLGKAISLKRDPNDLKRKTVFKELKTVFNIAHLNKSNCYSYSGHS